MSFSADEGTALLDSVKVMVPEVPGSRSLNSVASVTVKGNALYVDVWEDDVSTLAHDARVGFAEAQLEGRFL